jgi:hypothetical protein
MSAGLVDYILAIGGGIAVGGFLLLLKSALRDVLAILDAVLSPKDRGGWTHAELQCLTAARELARTDEERQQRRLAL